MKKPIKRAAVIHDLCGIGKAALTNIIPVLSMMEIEVCPIPTIILSTHTGGFGTPAIVTLDNYINAAADHYRNFDIEFAGIFIGYLGSENKVNQCINFIESMDNNKSLIVIDPIFGDNGMYYSNFDKEYSDSLRELIKYADIITPNYTEACLLTDSVISDNVTDDHIKIIGRKLYLLGCKNIIITSIPRENIEMIGTAVYDGENDILKVIESKRQKRNYPGTGDIFTSVLLGNMLNEKTLFESCTKACEFVEKCMRISSNYNYSPKEGVLLEKCLKYLN